MEKSLIAKAQNFSSFFLALYESINIRSTAQLAIFMSGADYNFEITIELAAIIPLKDTTRSIDWLEGVIWFP